MKKAISIICDGLLAGIFLCVGCTVNILSDFSLAGAFMFSLGLFAIITFKLALYTGKAGYIAVNPASYIGEVALTLFGNALGAAAGGLLLNLTHLDGKLSESAAAIMQTKMTDSPLSIFVLAVFCGMLMFTAVHGEKCNREKGNFVGGLFIVVLPVMVFIKCGFNHCVADLAYFFISGCANAVYAPLYFVLAILGNAIGCMLIPIVKKLSEKNV